MSHMSDAELKQYFLKHRRAQRAFQAYLDRLNQRLQSIIASPGDPDFDVRVQTTIRQKLGRMAIALCNLS